MSPCLTTPFVFALVLACSGEKTPAPATDSGGTLVIAVGGDPETLFPPLASTTTAQVVGDLVYDRLAEIGDSLGTVGDQGFQPRLAKTWEWAPDSLSIAFHIDPAARWDWDRIQHPTAPRRNILVEAQFVAGETIVVPGKK